MTVIRDGALGRLLRHAESAFHQASAVPPASTALADRVFRALDRPPADPAPAVDGGNAGHFPACAFLADALGRARGAGGPVAGLADALDALSPRLAWERRAGAESGPEGFLDGHANAQLAGPRGFERRFDVLAGLSLIAPGVRYPDHHHPPEEFYVVMSAGQWRQEDGPWHEPGPGGVVHNPPGIVHAMRAGDSPLLALWFLWTG